jgi:hypothetical protein
MYPKPKLALLAAFLLEINTGGEGGILPNVICCLYVLGQAFSIPQATDVQAFNFRCSEGA